MATYTLEQDMRRMGGERDMESEHGTVAEALEAVSVSGGDGAIWDDETGERVVILRRSGRGLEARGPNGEWGPWSTDGERDTILAACQ